MFGVWVGVAEVLISLLGIPWPRLACRDRTCGLFARGRDDAPRTIFYFRFGRIPPGVFVAASEWLRNGHVYVCTYPGGNHVLCAGFIGVWLTRGLGISLHT